MPKTSSSAGAIASASGADDLLTFQQFADLTNTTARLARRLAYERRIRSVKIGRYVRIPRSAVADFIAAGTVEAVEH